MFVKGAVGFVLGGFVTDFTENEKLLFAAKGLELNVIVALIVLLVEEQDTDVVSVYPAQLGELIVKSGADGNVNYIISPVCIAMLD